MHKLTQSVLSGKTLEPTNVLTDSSSWKKIKQISKPVAAKGAVKPDFKKTPNSCVTANSRPVFKVSKAIDRSTFSSEKITPKMSTLS